jgi:hypothetical protein
MTRARRREYVQDLIDIMLAASPPPSPAEKEDDRRRSRIDNDDDYEGRDVHGNLARELANVFHCLSSPPSSSAGDSPSSHRSTTANGGVVYVNRHIAVAIDSIHDDSSSRIARQRAAEQQQCRVRPHQTLLFPASSASEVLEGLTDETQQGGSNSEMTTTTTSCRSTSQSLRRILPHLQPRRSLHEIAWDAGLPLDRVLDAADRLVLSGTCVASTPVLPGNRYACADGVVGRMATMALPFWQAFGVRCQNRSFRWGGLGGGGESAGDGGTADDDAPPPRGRRSGASLRPVVTVGAPHLFVVVSALTTGSGRGPSYSASPTLGDAIRSLGGGDARAAATRGQSPPGGDDPYTDSGPSDEIVYSMAVWLIANNIIVEVKDYLISVEPLLDLDNGSKPNSSHESLYEELLRSGYLDGTTPVAEICYEFGIDQTMMDAFIQWGLQTQPSRLKVLSWP